MPTPEKVVSLDPDPEAVDLDPQPPVWFDVVFELRGAQRVVGFAMKASPTRVFAQMQFMSHTHYAWEAGDPFLERYQRLTQVIALAESSQGGDEAGDHAAEERERGLGFSGSGSLAASRMIRRSSLRARRSSRCTSCTSWPARRAACWRTAASSASISMRVLTVRGGPGPRVRA